MASKGVGSIGQRAEKSFGAGSAGDKRRTENRVAKQAPKALDQTRNPLSRAISSKKAGFGYLPSANQKTMMAGVVKKQEAADFEAAAKPLAGLDSTQVLAKMGEAGATDLTKRAAVARLAELGAHDQLAKALTNHYGGNTSDENWQKATASKASDLAKVAPHLTMGSDAATDTYKKMSAEQVAALSEDGFKQWSQRVSTDRVAEIGQQFASSPPLQSKTNDVRRAILNSATGSTPGRSDYVPSPQEVAVGNAYTDAHAINDSMNVAATATTTARSNVQGYLNDSTRSGTTPADHADIHSTYATNDLYKQAVDHAIITGSTVPKPFHNDPLAQGEVKIPGDDRSVS
jgi:hypothetical protein